MIIIYANMTINEGVKAGIYGEGALMKDSNLDIETTIRKFHGDDAPAIIEILKLNGQYSHPIVDGPEAMSKVSKNPSVVFLVSEIDGIIIGSVRGIYDGSRALIHQITVHPNWQGKGIGTKLIKNIASEFRDRGAPTISVTAGKSEKWDSIEFFEKLGFEDMPIKLMIHFDINELIKELK
ncbi:MAG: GNAT family N-acetyltransferase [Thermoplasmata archaeon]|nr:MAG: GNAT family N-acetyltransferase [Thermoplasmata archaeon]